MKKAAGTLRLDLAQYREMETFSQFSGDMDEATKRQIRYGEGLMNILRQKQNSPRTLPEQVFMLVIATTDKFEKIDYETIGEKIEGIVKSAMGELPDIVMRIENEGTLTDEDRQRIYETVIRQNV
jgi:F-type H+-transporting ATPase subunit alpha